MTSGSSRNGTGRVPERATTPLCRNLCIIDTSICCSFFRNNNLKQSPLPIVVLVELYLKRRLALLAEGKCFCLFSGGPGKRAAERIYGRLLSATEGKSRPECNSQSLFRSPHLNTLPRQRNSGECRMLMEWSQSREALQTLHNCDGSAIPHIGEPLEIMPEPVVEIAIKVGLIEYSSSVCVWIQRTII